MKKFGLKKLTLLFAFVLLVVGAFYWREISCFSLNLYLKKFCHDHFNGSFHSNRIYNDAEHWIIDQPEIIGRDPLNEGGIHFHAEKILLSMRPHLITRQLDLSITVIKPSLNIKQTATDIQTIVAEMFPSSDYFNVNAKISVVGGTLHFHDFRQEPSTRQTLYFQIEGESNERQKGQIVVSLDDPLLVNNCVMLSLAQFENQLITLDFNLDQVKCASLLSAASNFVPLLQYFDVDEGEVSGAMTLTVPENGKPYAKGDLTLNNVHFSSPFLEVQGSIQEAFLHLKESSKNELDSIEKSSTKGFLELTKEATLEFEKEGRPYCKISDLLGGIYFEKQDNAEVKLEGKCSHHGTISHMKINGFAKHGKGGINLNLQTALSSPENQYAKAKLNIRALDNLLNYAEVNLEHISSTDFDLLKMLFAPYFPTLNDIRMNKGYVNASASAYLDGFQMTDVKIEEIKAEGIHLNLTPWNLIFKVGNLAGNFSVNLKAPVILDTLHADLDISDSHLGFFGENSAILQLTDMHTKLAVRKGIIEKSIVKGSFAGLKGSIQLDGSSFNLPNVAKFNFQGEANEILHLLADPLKEKLIAQFSKDQFSITGTIQQIALGIKVEAALNVKGQKERFGQTIEYGFDLEKIPRGSNEATSYVLPQSILHEFNTSLMASSPAKEAEELSFFKWLNNELLSNGVFLKDGWCQAQNLPLKKYVEPFLFSQNQALLTGIGDFQATFNNHHAIVNFDLRQTILDNKSLNIDIKNLTANLEKEPALPLPATYYLDFEQDVAYGVIPIANGNYLEKKSGLYFTDVNTLLLVRNKEFHLTDLKLTCKDMHFGGKIETDLSSPCKGVFQVNVFTDTIRGRFSQLQQIFSHFDSLAFMQKIPIDGDLQLREKGASLRMNFLPEDFHVASHVEGTLLNGHSSHLGAEASVNDLKTDFAFDHTAKTLSFSDIQGKIEVGKNEKTELYLLAGDHIHFTDISKKEAIFDIWIGDSSRDILRVAGKTLVKSSNDKNILEILLDQDLTHFGDIKLKNFELSLSEDNQINKFNIEAPLKMDALLYDLKLANLAGLVAFPSSVLVELHNLKNISGNANVRVMFDDRTSIWTGHLDGSNVVLGSRQYNKFSLHGKKNGQIWAIDQLLLDDLSIAADLVRNPEGWTANFLGLRYGESLLVGMEGEFHDRDTSFDGRVNLLELNFDKLKEWPKLHEFIQENSPKGFLKGSGTIHAKTESDSADGWHIDLSLTAALKSFNLRGMSFEDSANVACHYVSNRGISFGQYKTALRDTINKKAIASLNMEKIDYDFNKNEVAIEKIHFNIPSQYLTKTINQLQFSFPAALNSQTSEIIKKLKSENSLEGSFDLTHSPAATQLQVSLKDDTYHFLGRDHETHQLVLKHNLNSLKILTQYRINDYLCWLVLQTAPADFTSGRLTLSDHYPDIHHKGQPALHVHWHSTPQDGFLIDKAQGLFSGLMFNLIQDKELLSNNEGCFLQGSVTVDPNKASKLISNNLSTQLASLEIGDGFELRGKWCIDKQNLNPGLPLYFQGIMQGEDLILKGYEFKTLVAQVGIQPQNIHIQQLKLEDPALKASIDQAYFSQTIGGEWLCNIPSIHITELKPSLLHEPKIAPSKQPGTLVVRSMEIENFHGALSDSKTFTGKGKLQFINPPKKNLTNAIFAIPAEILTMLGLNLSVLNPVSGSVFYEIKEGKFYLNKFKDVYSEGKLSKFNLSNTKTDPSYVDFEGNLFLRIKMKQYNLFFKLAELFTVNVSGTLQKPAYSLHKHTNKDTANK